MSLPTAMKVVALVVVALLLVPAFLAMGPIGWVGIGSMLLVGVVQVHRKRSAVDRSRPEYCPNCGTEQDDEVFATDDSGGEWKLATVRTVERPSVVMTPGASRRPEM